MAYAAVISLKHTIERLTNPTNPQITKSKELKKFLKEVVLERLEANSNTTNSSVITALDAQIREAVYKFERLVYPINPQITESAYEELNLTQNALERLDFSSNSNTNRSVINALDDQIRDAVSKLECMLQSVDEKKVEQEIDSFMKTVKKLRDEYNEELENKLLREEDDDAAAWPIDDEFVGNNSRTVGLSDQFEKIRNELLDLQSRLKIVSLVGMAGIGKTFLATKIYLPLTNLRHFNLTAKVKVGPKRRLKNVLIDILSQIAEHGLDHDLDMNDEHALAELLYRSLHGRRYFIVLDDIWNTGVWDYLMRFFPDNRNGSRLLLTTRLEKLAHPSTYRVHNVRFLTNEESWNLLWKNVFHKEESVPVPVPVPVPVSFPPQLEKVGRKIAENCEGLPLLILAVADILRGEDKTEEYWKKVADKKTTTFRDAYDKISKVLSTSYEYLSQHLKPCFLHMGVFPQTCEIPISKLINLWSFDDFLEPNQSQAFQDFCVECVEKLVSQSLVIVCKQSSHQRIKSSKLHSAYWHLCVKEARKIKFLHVLNSITDVCNDHIASQRRLSVQNNTLLGIKGVSELMAAATATARSLLCTGPDHQYPVQICFSLVLLVVLDALAIRFYEFPTEVLKLLQLRYLALTHNGSLPSSISQLGNLQCLIVRQHHNIKFLRNPTCLPKEIWDMQELRHLRIMGSNLPNPSIGAELPKLLTIYVNGHSCTEEIFRSIPYVKKLGIRIELQPDAAETLNCFEHIGLLHELESLKCVIMNPRLRSQVVAPPDHLSNLPLCLKMLSLNGLGYSWDYMSAIGSLPNLQVLKLRCYAFQGPEWETEVGEFRSLEFLLLEDIDLVHWTTNDEKCFPRLHRLMICHCYKLREIPSKTGDVPTLKTIEIDDCSPSVVDSAQQIQKEERYYGNFSLQLITTSS